MGRLVELRRRPGGAAAALHVLTVQRCAAAFVVILSYGALLWVMYSVWLRDVRPEEDLRPGPATLPMDYEAYRTSERARAARGAAERLRTLSGVSSVSYSARTVSEADKLGKGSTGAARQTDHGDVPSDTAFSSVGGDETDVQSDTDVEDNLVEFENEGDEDAFEDTDADEEEDTEPPLNRRLLVFNNIPHTGSEVITLLLRWLGKQNKFQYTQLRTETTAEGPLKREQQKRLVHKMTSLSEGEGDGACVSHSAYVMDFDEHGASLPLRFSMIRDPIDRIMARFTHDRVLGGYSPPPSAAAGWAMTLEDCLRTSGAECTYMNGHQYPELTVPYFCGHHAECTRHNSRWALERAKRTVTRQFVTVGVLEDMNSTLAVAETLLPRYFAGAWDRFFIDLVGKIGDSMTPRALDTLSPKARQELRANLTTEYEFYDFVKQRVVQQYNAFVPGSSS